MPRPRKKPWVISDKLPGGHLPRDVMLTAGGISPPCTTVSTGKGYKAKSAKAKGSRHKLPVLSYNYKMLPLCAHVQVKLSQRGMTCVLCIMKCLFY